MKKNRRGLFLVFVSLAGFAALVAVDNSRLQDKSNSGQRIEKTGVSPELAKQQREAARKPKSSPASKNSSKQVAKTTPRKTM